MLELTLTVGLALPTATPIVIRHDRDDAAYRELAARFPSACDIETGGVGVLIRPRWVLTAAHVADGVNPFAARVGFGGTHRDDPGPDGFEARVDLVRVHPDWAQSEADGIQHDIALLRLSEAVAGVEPAPLFLEAVEPGREVVLVGCGLTGDGHSGAATRDGAWRAATNRIWRVEPDRVLFRFEEPGGGATELEGFWAPGDSGCPAYVETEAGWRVLAVSSYGFDPSDDRTPANYGEHDASFLASHYADWIEETIREAEAAPGSAGAFGPVVAVVDGRLPETGVGECAAAYLDALGAGEEERAAFEAVWSPAEPPWQLPPGIGPLVPIELATVGERGLALRVTSPVIDEDLLLTLELAPGRRGGLKSVALDLLRAGR